MFVRINPYISKFVKRPDIARNLSEQRIKSTWQEIMSSINKSARNKSQALYIDDRGELVVKVCNHLWLQEISFYKEEIKKRALKDTAIKSIKLII